MKVKAIGQVLTATEKEGKNGKYTKLVLLIGDDIVDAFTKNKDIEPSGGKDIEMVLELKKYKGAYSSVQCLGVTF